MTDDGGLSDAGDAGPPPCTGCLELRANVTEAGNSQTAFFQLQFGAQDLDGVLVTFRIAGLPSEENVNVTAFATDGEASTGSDFTFGPGDDVLISDEDGFVDLDLDISDVAANETDFDETDVIAIGIQVDYFDTITGDDQRVTVLLDSVEFDNDGDEFDDLSFTTDEEGFGLNINAGSQDAEVILHAE